MPLMPHPLEGHHVRLEPVSATHREGLRNATADGRLWELKVTTVPSPAEIDAWIDAGERANDAGERMTYVVLHRPTGTVLGSTSFLRYEPPKRKIEIGGTWLASSWQRTPVNTEMKLLMLRHAFETMDCIRVAFITDMLNGASRAAIERLGARFEGCLRYERIMPDGRHRDTALYSIIAPEWPTIAATLERKLTRPFDELPTRSSRQRAIR